MQLEKLISKLGDALKEELPGVDAHSLMKPISKHGLVDKRIPTEKTRQGGVMILLYEQDDEIRFPVIQRPKYEGVHSGQIALPGGAMEHFDKSIISTAVRETREEIGVPEKEIEILGKLSEFYVSASDFLVSPVVGYVGGVPSFDPDPKEVQEVLPINLEDLLNKEKVKQQEMTVRGGFEIISPYFDLQQRVIWGATAMILSEFISVLQKQ